METSKLLYHFILLSIENKGKIIPILKVLSQLIKNIIAISCTKMICPGYAVIFIMQNMEVRAFGNFILQLEAL